MLVQCSSVATLQLQGPWLEPEFGLLSVCCFMCPPRVCMGSFSLACLLSPPKKCCAELLLAVNVCAWCHVMDVQCSWEKPLDPP